MGGHEHHREGHKSSRSGAWEGFEKLKQALEGLATAKGVSQSRIGAVAKLATHYSKFYKHVVHDIEVFLWKAEVEHRLAGLYAIDAIIRQAHAKNDSKDAYVKRFLIRLSDTIAAVKKVPEQFQPKVRHVIEEWQKRGIYTSKQIEDVGGHEYLHTGQEGNGTPRASSGKLASLLSILKQKKEAHSGEHQGRPDYDDKDRRQRDDAEVYNHRSYDERGTDDQRYDRRDVGGIMGDAPGVPVGSGRIRRDPDDRPSDMDDRDPKKARGSRWGPPKLDNPSSDRPAPIITSLDREGDYRPDSNRSGYGSPPGTSRQASLMQSPRGGPPRHEEWNRNAPSSRGSGAGWPRENVRSPQSGGLSRNNVSPYEQGIQRSPFSGSDDRRSPGNRVPGTSGEVCRNFLAGRCTFGDRCWHIHDPQAASSGGGRSEVAEAKRKTVLCNNYPLGKCRFGDKCSFAHGEDELDKSARYPPRPPANGDQSGGHWQPSPSAHPAMEQSRTSPSVNVPAPSTQARSYGAPQVYNEPLGDRGSRGDSSVSYANAAAPSPGRHRLPPDHLAASTALPQGYTGTYASASSPYGATGGGSTFANQGPSFSSGDQGRNHVPDSAPVLPSPVPGSQSYGDRTTASIPSAKVLVDDDDADTVEPEFTLEYDDDD